jgi:ABC-type dipeptide/oligopeptide/nickel transport system permease subunit
MTFRKALNDKLLTWKLTGGVREQIADLLERSNRAVMIKVGLFIVLFVVVAALLAPVLPVANPLQRDNTALFDGLSSPHWFGTDELGRDVFSRVLWGSRVSLLVGTVAVLFSLTIGLVLGLVAGYFGGKIDYLISGIIDIFWTLPTFLLALAFAAALGPSLTNVIIAISISSWAGYARLVRGQALSVRERLFVDASRALGASHRRIMFLDILPNCIAPITVWASIGVADAIVLESSLSFLGIGTQPPYPSWGYMLSSGRRFLDTAPWIATFPGIAIVLVILGFNLFGDGLRDVLDPRMKGLRK